MESNIKDIKKLKLYKDYTYDYPTGVLGEPQLESIDGEYRGLTIEFSNSMFVENDTICDSPQKFLNFDYKIINMWDNVDSDQFDGTKIKLNQKDITYISSMVYSFLDEIIKSKSPEIGTIRKL